jgi:four helix bundle protein
MQNYKDLKVWAKAHQFTLQVYKATENFPKTETYGITNQLRRGAASVPANLAEGCGKNTKPDFANFLNIALGSSNESEYFLLLSKDLGYLSIENYEVLTKDINEIKAMLISLIGKVRS